jgi:hypothetical protein
VAADGILLGSIPIAYYSGVRLLSGGYVVVCRQDQGYQSALVYHPWMTHIPDISWLENF